jgi:hypothetical protein
LLLAFAFNRLSLVSVLGTQVKIARSDDGRPGFTVRATTGELIGYVPKRFLSVVHDFNGQSAVLKVADYDAVPWKRFRVEIKAC